MSNCIRREIADGLLVRAWKRRIRELSDGVRLRSHEWSGAAAPCNQRRLVRRKGYCQRTSIEEFRCSECQLSEEDKALRTLLNHAKIRSGCAFA